MKIKRTTLFRIYIYFLIFINLGFGRAIDTFIFTARIESYITAFSAVILALVCITSKGISRIINPYLKVLNRFTVIYFGTLAILFLYTIVKYDMPVNSVITSSLKFWCVLLIYPLVYILKVDRIDKFVNGILIFTVAALLFRFVVWYINNYYGAVVFPGVIYEYSEWTRNGLYRLTDTCFGGLGFIISCFKYIKEKVLYRKILYFATTALFMIYAQIVFASRGEIISMGITIILMYTCTRKNGLGKLIKWTVICSIIAICSHLLKFCPSFIELF